uniref:Uncharacterized protein n=1 Tax=Naja naja TaxID=35670 RepID=A0A8C6Y5Y3_NAJNA
MSVCVSYFLVLWRNQNDHVWWKYRKTKEFWQRIQKWLEEMLGHKIEFKPEFSLLGIITEKYNKEEIYLIIHVIMAARLAFSQMWKNK